MDTLLEIPVTKCAATRRCQPAGSVEKLLKESIQNGGKAPSSDKDKFQLLGYWRNDTHTDFAGLSPKQLLAQLREVTQDDPNRSRKLLSCVFNLVDDGAFADDAKGVSFASVWCLLMASLH